MIKKYWPDIAALERAAYPVELVEGESALGSKTLCFSSGCFVAKNAEDVVGYLIAYPLPWGKIPHLAECGQVDERINLHIHDIVVATSYRNQAVARGLLSTVFSQAKKNNFLTVSLVSVNNSKDYWQRQGFHLEKHASRELGYGADAYYMTLTLQ